MRIINKDLTQESITLSVSNNQIYARIWSKHHGKWCIDTYFQSYDWEIDKENVDLTIKYIKNTWNLTNPRITID